jgi:hypothetical protein
MPLMTCITLMIGAGESPGIGPMPIPPISTAGGSSLSNGGGAQSTYFVLNCRMYSLGNNGCGVFTPPGITPEIAALMKWLMVEGWKFGPPTKILSDFKRFRVYDFKLTFSFLSVFRTKALKPCHWSLVGHRADEKQRRENHHPNLYQILENSEKKETKTEEIE